MKYFTLSVSLLLLAAVSFSQTDPAASEETSPPPDMDIYLSGGMAFGYLPMEFSDYWKPGIGGGAGFGYSFAPGDYGYSSVALMVKFGSFKLDESAFREGMKISDPAKSVSGGETSCLTVTGNYKGTLSTSKRSIAPYFTVGVGYILFNSDSVMVDQKGSLSIEQSAISAITWSFGLGVEIPVNDNFTGFIQGESFIGAFDRTVQYFPVSAGVQMRF